MSSPEAVESQMALHFQSMQKIDEQIVLLTKILGRHTELLAQVFKDKGPSTRVLN